jgi:hypothetical protein
MMMLRLIESKVFGAVAVKIHKDTDTGEFRVRLYRSGIAYEPADYFTDDKKDAQGTAADMLKRG